MASSNDVTPALYHEITEMIRSVLEGDKNILRIADKVRIGSATHADTAKFAKRLGEITSDAFQEVLTEDVLPDGKLYYHIAVGSVGKTIANNLQRVNMLGNQIQNNLNEQAGIGLQGVEATLNKDRVHDLVSEMANCETLDEAREWMGEPVVNTTQSFADDYVETNAQFQYDAGLQPVIKRTADATACPWCLERAGEYNYPLADNEVYRRHEHCNCVVTFDPRNNKKWKNGIQNVHTKQWITDPKLVEERRKIGLVNET